MKQAASRARLPALVMAMCLSATPAAFAQQVIAVPEAPGTPPDVDPLDKASCEVKDGWLTVYKAYVLAWNDARSDGRISPELHEALVEKLLKADDFYAETGDAITLCREMIDTRMTYRF